MIELLSSHPGDRRLDLYADGELGERDTRRIATHLSHCARCRETLQSLRALERAARELAVPDPSSDLLERILERKRDGEVVILPVGAPARPRPRRRITTVVAASVLLLLGAAVFTLAPDADAQGSELRLLPGKPGAGERVQVEYRPGSALTGEDTLVLRARYRTPDDGWENWMVRHETVAKLVRTRGGYRGTFRLPDSVVYAVFAVEDLTGERVDHKGEAWDLVVHGEDGRPLAPALEQRIRDLDRRSTQQALETARQLTTAHPHWVQGWLIRFSQEYSQVGEAGMDSLRPFYAVRAKELSAQLERQPRLAPEEMGAMVSLVWRFDSVAARRWKERLVGAYPTHPATVEHRVSEAVDRVGADPARLLPELERLWSEVGSHYRQLDLAVTGLRIADQAEDTAAVLRWAPRVEAAGSRLYSRTPAAILGRYASTSRAVREEAMLRLRRELGRLAEHRSDERILTHTVTDRRIQNQHIAGQYLGYLGQALLLDGDTAAALNALDRAARSHWNVGVFRAVADVKLSLGDTTGALQLLAKVAADPSTSTTFADSVRLRIGRPVDPQQWRQWLGSADEEMRRYFLAWSVDRPLRGKIRLLDQRGRSTELDPAGDLTLVALWSSDCPSAVRQMPQLQAIFQQLGTSGLRVVTITPEEPSKVRDFLAQNQYGFPVFHDVKGDARRAFDEWGYPTFFVVDGRGRIRFKSYRLDDVPRQIAVLQKSGREM
jgi:peroxiredoxin